MTYRIMMTLLAVLIVPVPGRAFATTVWLENGDRISGTVVGSDPEAIALETTYFGTVTIDRNSIADIGNDESEKGAIIDNVRPVRAAVVDEAPKTEPVGRQTTPPSTVGEGADHTPPSAVQLTGWWNLGINMTDGNSDVEAYYGDAEVIARAEKRRFTAGGKYNRVENAGDPTLDYQAGYLKFDNFLNGKLYLHSSAGGIWDKFKDLRLKSSLGLGLGYQFVETSLTKLSLELSGSYVNEDHIAADDKDFASGRWELSLDHFLYQDVVEFFHKHVGLVSLVDTADASLQAQTGLRFRVYAGLIATAQLNHSWDNAASTDLENMDETYMLTLGHRF